MDQSGSFLFVSSATHCIKKYIDQREKKNARKYKLFSDRLGTIKEKTLLGILACFQYYPYRSSNHKQQQQ
jgi:hypothetical protein